MLLPRSVQECARNGSWVMPCVGALYQYMPLAGALATLGAEAASGIGSMVVVCLRAEVGWMVGFLPRTVEALAACERSLVEEEEVVVSRVVLVVEELLSERLVGERAMDEARVRLAPPTAIAEPEVSRWPIEDTRAVEPLAGVTESDLRLTEDMDEILLRPGEAVIDRDGPLPAPPCGLEDSFSIADMLVFSDNPRYSDPCGEECCVRDEPRELCENGIVCGSPCEGDRIAIDIMEEVVESSSEEGS